MGRKPLFYAVIRGEAMSNGFNHSIFTEWTECSKYVTGVKGAVFQSCKTLDQAVILLRQSDICSSTVYVYYEGKWLNTDQYLLLTEGGSYKSKSAVSVSEETDSEIEYDTCNEKDESQSETDTQCELDDTHTDPDQTLCKQPVSPSMLSENI